LYNQYPYYNRGDNSYLSRHYSKSFYLASNIAIHEIPLSKCFMRSLTLFHPRSLRPFISKEATNPERLMVYLGNGRLIILSISFIY